jgi:hypothetical protein
MARGQNMVWVLVKKPLKFKRDERDQVERFVKDFIEKTVKLKKDLSRILVKAGRVYIYKLFEPALPESEDVVFTKPLIDGKYIEYPYLRITLYNPIFKDCTLDFQRHNGEWMTIDKGTLEECFTKAEENDWFD